MQPVSSLISVARVQSQFELTGISPKSLKAARDFEANLIGSLLESLEKTYSALPGESDVVGADDYNYLGTEALASAIADRGGFGIARLIARDLAAHESKP